MKSLELNWGPENKGPTPHGVGGLKLIYRVNSGGTKASHPSRGGWIEMVMPPPKSVRLLVPPLTGWVD